jgi:hypothetical protein
MTAVQQRAGRGLVSAIIIVILGTQFVAGLVDTNKWGWPILAYPMYKWPHYENERILHDADVYAQLDDGSRIAITPEALGMSFWIFFYNVFLALRDADRSKLGPVIVRYCAQAGGRVRELLALDKGIAVTREGPRYGLPPTVVYAMSVQCP